MPALHRDVLDGGIYTVFLLITPMTEDNGTVKMFLNSHKWERNWRLSSEDVLKQVKLQTGIDPEPIIMTGEMYDIVVFDGRLLHQSVYNNTTDDRIVFGFFLFDEVKYPNYVNQYGP